MNIDIRWIGTGKYAEVIVGNDGHIFDLGFLDAAERATLAETLRAAADELDPEDSE